MIAVSTTPSPTAGTFAAPPDAPVYAVVGFDGSHSSLRAVDAAARRRPVPVLLRQVFEHAHDGRSGAAVPAVVVGAYAEDLRHRP
jgi:hypothetical protein